MMLSDLAFPPPAPKVSTSEMLVSLTAPVIILPPSLLLSFVFTMDLAIANTSAAQAAVVELTFWISQGHWLWQWSMFYASLPL